MNNGLFYLQNIAEKLQTKQFMQMHSNIVMKAMMKSD